MAAKGRDSQVEVELALFSDRGSAKCSTPSIHDARTLVDQEGDRVRPVVLEHPVSDCRSAPLATALFVVSETEDDGPAWLEIGVREEELDGCTIRQSTLDKQSIGNAHDRGETRLVVITSSSPDVRPVIGTIPRGFLPLIYSIRQDRHDV